ncbi:Uncharacterised protein [Clostridium putrefaciens]|uniref:Uncharacterized protein n=1 Tax=Clostridium putrefaciens TaxID=99675 RepID=A0A381J601_9CLOT|nr:CLC_0170 family protein [Clostridium putrefaciens]SUY46650.1 Uncharacterised protein [Clostridium putrefaciens]
MEHVFDLYFMILTVISSLYVLYWDKEYFLKKDDEKLYKKYKFIPLFMIVISIGLFTTFKIIKFN